MKLTGLSFLFTCQPTKSFNFSRSGVIVRAHLLRKNYSRNFSSIRSAPRVLDCRYNLRDKDHGKIIIIICDIHEPSKNEFISYIYILL